MTNPYSRVVTALTYIHGDQVNSWKAEQLKKLNQRVAGGTAEADEAHWTAFETDFKAAYTDVDAKAQAYYALLRLQQKGNLDLYIAEFKRYTAKAEI